MSDACCLLCWMPFGETQLRTARLKLPHLEHALDLCGGASESNAVFARRWCMGTATLAAKASVLGYRCLLWLGVPAAAAAAAAELAMELAPVVEIACCLVAPVKEKGVAGAG
eukprot:1103808-Pelagomonas_calceolata.AAC.3